MLDVGSPAPSFLLPNASGNTVSLADYAEQWRVVYFYPRADTPGCTTEACEFRDRWASFAEYDVAVLGISDDPVDDLADFREEYSLPFELLSDEDGSVASAYDSYGEKQMFGNTFDGVFRNTYVIDPSGTIATVFESVTPEGHADEILESIPDST